MPRPAVYGIPLGHNATLGAHNLSFCRRNFHYSSEGGAVIPHYRVASVQGLANPRARGLVNFVTADAYHFCLNLPDTFSQPGPRGLADPCM